jgi:hypothetical protein
VDYFTLFKTGFLEPQATTGMISAKTTTPNQVHGTSELLRL